MTGDGINDDAVAILRAILDVPSERRLEALALAIRAVLDSGQLSGNPLRKVVTK